MKDKYSCVYLGIYTSDSHPCLILIIKMVVVFVIQATAYLPFSCQLRNYVLYINLVHTLPGWPRGLVYYSLQYVLLSSASHTTLG